MSLDCNYQGIPSDLSFIIRAMHDIEFCENVFYPFIAFTKNLEDRYYFNESEFDEVRLVIQKYPKIKTWNYKPVSRMQSALIFVLSPQNYQQSKNLEMSFIYKFVMGEKIFSENLTSTSGIRVRISSPAFIKECAEYARQVNISEIRENFDPVKMDEEGVYKILPNSEVQPILDYFYGLRGFYERMAAYENLSVFIAVD